VGWAHHLVLPARSGFQPSGGPAPLTSCVQPWLRRRPGASCEVPALATADSACPRVTRAPCGGARHCMIWRLTFFASAGPPRPAEEVVFSEPLVPSSNHDHPPCVTPLRGQEPQRFDLPLRAVLGRFFRISPHPLPRRRPPAGSSPGPQATSAQPSSRLMRPVC